MCIHTDERWRKQLKGVLAPLEVSAKEVEEREKKMKAWEEEEDEIN